ncbi:hypothetical protein DQ384_24500 [Sphaerisporangium album]|uniref:DUF1273 family protein n=1 Tax=Sphaerisporangium album TaxID=509200 RepID=A0A367FEE0_9ACTN|nr:hypothetical protein [Sphaerisporangium album]RCG28289.1 hypothetical protein DQ384_24500 [Sphaerisporangium album]
MTVVGITGHRSLPPRALAHAERELRALLAGMEAPLIGWSSLAAGADQLFAEILLRAGGELRVVVPSHGYEATFRGPGLDAYRRLLAAARVTTVLDFAEPGEPAYYAAGCLVVENCEVLVAVWDGRPARGFGGTADAVRYARGQGREVVVIWPEGVQRL